VAFVVPEDLPECEKFYGIDVFIVYCPICGQKLRFSIDACMLSSDELNRNIIMKMRPRVSCHGGKEPLLE